MITKYNDLNNRVFQNAGLQLHPKTQIHWGILENECSQIVKEFFQKKR